MQETPLPGILVADVGGTNARLALVDDKGGFHAKSRYANDEFGSFNDVLRRFCADHSLAAVDTCCVAVAGPVTSGTARLTNRDWTFVPAEMAAVLPGDDVRVRLINDLVALGHALSGLGDSQLSMIRPGEQGGESNGQALVFGLGTGFNGCLAKTVNGEETIVEAELGHASLPAQIYLELEKQIGAEVARFPTVEHLFSGRGFEQLYEALGGSRPNARLIVDRAGDGDAAAGKTVELMAHALGLLARQMVFQFLPLDGIYIAGSVSRAVLETPARKTFLNAMAFEGRFDELVARVPVRLITDDAAALTGMARLGLAISQRPMA